MDKNKRSAIRIRKVKDMTTTTINKSTLSSFIKQNKLKIYETARNNTNYNENGQPTISKSDSWFDENVWDKPFKKVNKK